MKVLVEDVLGPSLVGENPTRVEFLWEKMYSASRLPLALAHGPSVSPRGQPRRDDPCDQRRRRRALGHLRQESLGLPIYRLLGGGVRERMPAYASGGWAPPEGTVDGSSAIVPRASTASRSAWEAWTSRTFRNVRSSVCGRRWDLPLRSAESQGPRNAWR